MWSTSVIAVRSTPPGRSERHRKSARARRARSRVAIEVAISHRPALSDTATMPPAPGRAPGLDIPKRSTVLMVSSSAVISKVVAELKLTHERTSQAALAVTVLEDVVAVTMLTLLASQVNAGSSEGLGGLLGGLTAFVALLVGAGLMLVPRLLRRLEARADPEMQTVIVAGLLFILALAAAKGFRFEVDGVVEVLRAHRPPAALLHGDLWSGNVGFTAQGPVVFDPAVYYGDREADLAMTELFGGFPSEFYAAYREAYPLHPGYAQRKHLYNLYHLLNHLNLFGAGYAGQVRATLGLLRDAL